MWSDDEAKDKNEQQFNLLSRQGKPLQPSLGHAGIFQERQHWRGQSSRRQTSGLWIQLMS